MGEKGDNWIRGILESHPKKRRQAIESVNSGGGRGRFGGVGSDRSIVRGKERTLNFIPLNCLSLHL